MIGAVQQNFPPPAQAITTREGTLTQQGRFLLLALWQRTGAGPGIPFTVGNLDLAVPPTQAMANDINVVTGPAVPVTLFNLQPGQMQMVFNTGVNPAVDINPPPGGTIDGLGTPYSLAIGKSQIFTCIAQGVFLSLQLG